MGRSRRRAAPSTDADILVHVDVRLWVCRLAIYCHSSGSFDTFCLLIVPFFAGLTKGDNKVHPFVVNACTVEVKTGLLKNGNEVV